jgi:hypothetical protein
MISQLTSLNFSVRLYYKPGVGVSQVFGPFAGLRVFSQAVAARKCSLAQEEEPCERLSLAASMSVLPECYPYLSEASSIDLAHSGWQNSRHGLFTP